MSAPRRDIVESAEVSFAAYRGLGKDIIAELIDEIRRLRSESSTAPDLLLAAKEAAVVIADGRRVVGACLPRLLAAIAKAEGREPSP